MLNCILSNLYAAAELQQGGGEYDPKLCYVEESRME